MYVCMTLIVLKILWIMCHISTTYVAILKHVHTGIYSEIFPQKELQYVALLATHIKNHQGLVKDVYMPTYVFKYTLNLVSTY